MLIIVVELVHNREMVVIGVSGAYNWWSSGSTAIAPECVPYIPGHLGIVWGHISVPYIPQWCGGT